MIKKWIMSLVAIAVASSLTACSTIRMTYQAEVKPSNGKLQKFTHERSYPVGGANQELCIITGIFLGGYCWFYTVMPTVQQKDQVASDAKRYLVKQFPSGYTEANVVIDRQSWSDAEPKSELKEIND
jgi:hypothetical protein